MLKQPMGWKLFITLPWYKPLILELSNLLLFVQHACPMCPIADNLARGLFFQAFPGLSILIVSFVQKSCHLGKIGQRLYFFLMNLLFFFLFCCLLLGILYFLVQPLICYQTGIGFYPNSEPLFCKAELWIGVPVWLIQRWFSISHGLTIDSTNTKLARLSLARSGCDPAWSVWASQLDSLYMVAGYKCRISVVFLWVFLHQKESHAFRNSDDWLQAMGSLEHISSKLRTSVSGA